MKVIYAAEFQKQFRNLPREIQNAFYKQEIVFKSTWRDPHLHTKKLKDHPFPFSFRTTRNYRVLFVFVDSETALFTTIGNRKKVYR